jgi:hypothetical protein
MPLFSPGNLVALRSSEFKFKSGINSSIDLNGKSGRF